MNKTYLTGDFCLSRIIHGQMRIHDWKLSDQELLKLMEALVEIGVTTYDHADIYGDYSCEAVLGDVMMKKKGFRDKIEIITKCGIKLKSDKFPERQIKYYDYSYDYIINSVNTSLSNLRTDRIDLLLLHRPAPFFDPEAVARAFSKLKREGKVLHFGVSNFTPLQFEMLDSYLEDKLVTNQVEISPYCLEHFENGNLDFFLTKRIKPMSWSPLAGGRLLNASDEKGLRILHALAEVAEELNVTSIDSVIYAWLLQHPAGILPIVGSGKFERVKLAVEALDIKMSIEQWYKIYIASTGVSVA